MKVLWLCNIMLPAIAEALSLAYSSREGWLTGVYERICEENNTASEREQDRVRLGICFPASVPVNKTDFSIENNSVRCYAFDEDLTCPEGYNPVMEERLGEVIEDFKPDMIHIFGTEFPHTLAMVRAFQRPERTLIGIQGLCFACADAYMADLPEKVINRKTLRDLLRKDSILQQQHKFKIRGEREIEALKSTGNITGRTEFDRIQTGHINPRAKYFFLNETMRSPFYSGSWEPEQCIPHSIFLSQGDYPLKGFHYVLRAMPQILKSFPNACIYVAGNSITGNKTLKEKIKISSYGRYLLELIREGKLERHVKILGRLTADEMKEQFLKSSLYLCPSSLENSPNSLGEAMLLGVPAAAAATGGIPSLAEHEKEVLLYEPGNVEALAKTVIRIWMDKTETAKRAETARNRALKTHDRDSNYRRLIEIYREICK